MITYQANPAAFLGHLPALHAAGQIVDETPMAGEVPLAESFYSRTDSDPETA